MLDRANSGAELDGEILRAILHGAAAGACRIAARETGSAYWAGMAEDQRVKATVRLHQLAPTVVGEWAEARTSSVIPSPCSFE